MQTYVTIVQTGPREEVLLLEHLEALRVRGDASPAALVEEARADMSPLHGLFEWNDGVAAERYRLEQARQYIARVEFVPAEQREPLLIEMPVARARAAALAATCLTGVDLTMCSIDRLQAEIADLRKRYGSCPAVLHVLEGPLADAMQELTRVAMGLEIPLTDRERESLPALAG